MEATFTKPSTPPPAHVAIAIKEWAAVAAAMRAGRQSILLRAGGIADPAGRFGFAQPVFWIYPTRFHESADRLLPEARRFVESAAAELFAADTAAGSLAADTAAGSLAADTAADAAEFRAAGTVRQIDLLVTLEAVHWIDDRGVAEGLAPLHVLSATVVRERFDYREPGLAAALVRVWRRRVPHRIVETSAMEGCRSWVELPEPLACDALEPVLADDAFEAEMKRFQKLIKR